MKILVISDSHGSDDLLSCIIREHKDAEYIVFLGDGERDIEAALAENDIDPFDPSCRIKVIQVCGNCDLFSREPVRIVEEIGGRRFYITHGFSENVKFGMDRLAGAAASGHCDIALFGHTHRRCLSVENGVTCFNPGSVYSRSCGIIILEGGEASFEFCDI